MTFQLCTYVIDNYISTDLLSACTCIAMGGAEKRDSL